MEVNYDTSVTFWEVTLLLHSLSIQRILICVSYHLQDIQKEWAEFIFLNRDIDNTSAHNYDIVYGPIANDKVGAQIVNYKDGYIDFNEFLNRLKFFKGITYQYAFCTEESLKTLRKV